MRLFAAIVIFLLTASGASAQFIPNNSQAFQFMPSFNPAFSGIEDFQDIKVSYRYQWSGFGSNAPKFMNLSYSGRLKQPLDLKYNAPRSSHTTMLSPSHYPKAKTLIQGLGANVFHESYGPIKRTGGGLNYSIHYPVSEKVRLATGLGVIYESQSIGSDIELRDPRDPLKGQAQQQTTFSVRAGLLLYSRSFYVGASYLPVWSMFIGSSGLSPVQFYKGTAQAGVSLQVSPGLTLKPSVLALLQSDNQFQIDYNMKAFIQQKLWLGVTYRDIQSGVIMAGFDLSDALSASYSYEFSTGSFKQFSDASHELILGIRINNFKRGKQFTW